MKNEKLKNLPPMSVSDAAAQIGVGIKFYRTNILTLPSHPSPVNSNKQRVVFWPEMMVEFLADRKKLIHGPLNRTPKKAAASK